MTPTDVDALVVGAGPAGLTAGYELARRGQRVLVVERDPIYVGGIARTVAHHGLLFDIGGHRFFSKSERVEAFWTEILGDDLIVRRRASRIYYRHRFFSYPLRPLEALGRLGPFEALRCVLSFLRARLFPIREPRSFEDWVVNQFGRRLFTIFFKTYTEKVWGTPCSSISADWAAQRIRGLSLWGAVRSALFGPASGRRKIKSLIESFRYPRRGPGMMWDEVARRFTAAGGELLKGTRVARVTGDGVWAIELSTPSGPRTVVARHLLSSMPIRELGELLSPQLTPATHAATQAFEYRDFLIVVLAFGGPELFEDHWIYVHDPGVKVGRIQNFKRWSPEMVAEPGVTSYGMEYFCFEGDGLWSSSDEQLVELARRELAQMGLGAELRLVDSCVVRQPKAYPVYDLDYRARVDQVRRELASRWPTLQLIGRNGMHKYNNQDHAMMTGFLAAENVLRGEPALDLWRVNVDAEYIEEDGGASGERLVPETRA
jgi:protoporphyrinogen oxidase